MELSSSFTRALLDGFAPAYDELLRVAERRTSSREDAKELVHDTWMRLAEHQDSLSDAPIGTPTQEKGELLNARAYLATITDNLALDQLRRSANLRKHQVEQEALTALAPPHAPDVAESVMYGQALAVLQSVLDGLPARMREVFVAHRIQGEKLPALACRLGVSENTVERDLMQVSACMADALHRWRGSTPAAPAPSGKRRRDLAALLGIGTLGVSGTIAWWQWRAYLRDRVQWGLSTSTNRGQQQTHTLEDGSTLVLDARSRVEVRYYAGRRVVALLEGAAFFSVVRQSDRPFIVEVGAVRVTVLGTRFGVERVPAAGGESVWVQVESGRVRVEQTGRSAHELTAGDGLRILASGEAERTGGEAAEWRSGLLEFDNSTLGDALARLSRYSRADLPASVAASNLPLTGRVRVQQLGHWLEALPRAMPVRLVHLSGGAVRVVLRTE